jgi:hypothetical protein
MGLRVKEKLKALKGVLKLWNKEVYGGLEGKVVALTKGIELLDLKREGSDFEDSDNETQKNLFFELRHLLHAKDSLLFQRSRSRWLKEGDANTGYFHSCVASRKRCNAMPALRIGDRWVEKPLEVRGEVVEFFKNHFVEASWSRPQLDGVEFPTISPLQVEGLVKPFTVEEVRGVVEDSDGNKSPGPDGFNFAFLKSAWEVICGDVMGFMNEFHVNASLPKAFSSYFIALIPKILNPQALGDFRPISLLGCVYKLVAKVLTNRLSVVMDSITAKNQSAFIKGRLLVDGVLVINEVVDWVKKAKKKCVIFKVDFEKAYDSISWSFLDYMLRRFGFDGKWRNWIKACVFAGSLSVLVNGCPTEQIDISKGLKQGDPLAPFLFVLVAEGFGALMKKAVGMGFFKGIRLCDSGEHISHLQYADDTLLVGEACVENLWTMKAILKWFELISGLKVNFLKSKLIGINVEASFLDSAASFLKCVVGLLPFTYLGLPVGANPRRLSTWNPVLDVIQRRLASWKNKYVSLGGRVVLLNSVLSAIPIFYLSLFKMPVGVWKKLVRMQRRFLWGGVAGNSKISWVSWQDVCRTKREGGLGVKDLRIMNISLLTKWKWRLLTEGESIWRNVLKEKYSGGERGFGWLSRPLASNIASSWWNDLVSIGTVDGVDRLCGIFFKRIGNGGETSFWHDRWVGVQPLKDVFPRLFLVSTQKEACVSEVGRRVLGRWE